MSNSVVITGTGLALRGPRSATELPALLADRLDSIVPEAALSRRGMKYKDRASRLALCAVESALRDSGLVDAGGGYAGPPARTAVVVSSDLGCLDNVCSAIDTLDERTSAALSPMGLPHTAPNMVAGWLAVEHGLHGPNLTLSNGVTGGLDALFWGRSLIAAGRAEVVVVAGVEPDGVAVRRLLQADGIFRWLDGAAAVILEASARLTAGRPGRAALSGYARAGSLSEAIRQIGPEAAALWLRTGQGGCPPAGVHVVDLSVELGYCSGALGVLQCCAAVSVVERGGGPVLAACGGAIGGGAAIVIAQGKSAPARPSECTGG